MYKTRRSRSRDRGSHARRSRSRRNHSRKSRSTSRDRQHRFRDNRKRTVSRSRTRSPSMAAFRQSFETIASRLKVLEDRSRVIVTPDATSAGASSVATEKIVEAIQSLRSVNTQHYFISNFDPSVHNVDQWFEEVDRAKVLNKWSENECLSRVGNCLKGDARTWLNEWITSDRSWTNFKKDFRSLCVNKIDVADILYQVMSSDSDSYPTYAEYARRSLLRLRIVKGLSDDLITAIVIRGLKEPQIKASATNANLTPDNLVAYLSTFVKHYSKQSNSSSRSNNKQSHKVIHKRSLNASSSRCYNCGKPGHKQTECFKKPNFCSDSITSEVIESEQKLISNNICDYCKKPGHTAASCFAKQRAESKHHKSKINFCSVPNERSNDIIVGLIQGIPIDILIDTGALEVSLISSSVANHFSCARKPINQQLKGISNSVIFVNSYITLMIELEEITLEVDLLVVPSEYMNAPIIIGTDVLNRQGVTYIRTADYQRLTHCAISHLVSSVVSEVQNKVLKTTLVGEDLYKLSEILDKHSEFMISGTATSTVTTGSMHIRLNSDVPVNYRPYKMSYNEKLKVRDIIRDLLDKGIIRESESPYSSPILLVKKKNGSDRMCVDFRALNKITVKDRYPLPLIDDHIDRLGKSKYYTVLDMATGFHQILLDEESIPLTGFVTPEGHYEYLKMPYGLANAPIVYQRIISNTLREFIEAGKVLVYVDDCMLLSSSIEQGLQILNDVLTTLTKAGFSINLSKCSFLCLEIEYLGRIISENGVRPSTNKVHALVNSPIPQNAKQTRQFLGLAGYFRKYIAGYSTKTACISRLTRKGVDFEWGPQQENVRQELIKCLTAEPILAIFDPELPSEVHTDASSAGYGAVFLQVHKDGNKRVVAYYSQVTKGGEELYHSYELETLAVVRALKHFRHYLIGVPFTVVTDCNALKATQNKKDLLPRVARWWIYLQDFNFTIQYRKGVMIPHADYLSRNPVVTVNTIDKPRNWARMAQAGDEETQTLIRSLEEGKLDPSRYVKRNGLLYYRFTSLGEEPRLLCYIPKGQRLSLLRIFHDEHSHISADKTIHLILKHFWFPSIRTFVFKYVSHCLVCIAHKRVPRAPLQPISSWAKPNVPFDTLHVDALGPLIESKGNKHILVVVDAFTKYCLLSAICTQDLNELKRVMQNVISLFGTPKTIICDRGRMFQSPGFMSLMRDLSCQVHYITPEMHHANGQVERYIRTVLNMLRIEVNHRKAEWADELWKLQLVLNITKQKTTQLSPLNLLTGTESATPIIRTLIRDVAIESSGDNRESLREMRRQRTAERLSANQREQDKRVNNNRQTPRVYQKGDLVFVIKYSQSTGKLDPGMRGPYRVVGVLDNGRYELQLLAGVYGKTTFAAAQFMVPWRGEWTPETCAALFEGDNEDQDNTLDQPSVEQAGPSSTPDEDARMSGEAVLAAECDVNN